MQYHKEGILVYLWIAFHKISTKQHSWKNHLLGGEAGKVLFVGTFL